MFPIILRGDPYLNKVECSKKTVPELRDLCKVKGVKGYSRMKKAELIENCCWEKTAIEELRDQWLSTSGRESEKLGRKLNRWKEEDAQPRTSFDRAVEKICPPPYSIDSNMWVYHTEYYTPEAARKKAAEKIGSAVNYDYVDNDDYDKYLHLTLHCNDKRGNKVKLIDFFKYNKRPSGDDKLKFYNDDVKSARNGNVSYFMDMTRREERMLRSARGGSVFTEWDKTSRNNLKWKGLIEETSHPGYYRLTDKGNEVYDDLQNNPLIPDKLDEWHPG